MGLKNPQPDLSQRVIPVMSVGDFAHLTPAHQSPTAAFGGFIPAVVAEFSAFEIASRGEGGMFVAMATQLAPLSRWGTVDAPVVLTGPTVPTDRGP